jgi:hypothetical protein
MFIVDTGSVAGYLSASAVRVDPPAQERIWFFPTSGGDAPFITAGSGMAVASQGARLARDLAPGLYRVDLRFTPAPPTRALEAASNEGLFSVSLRIEK